MSAPAAPEFTTSPHKPVDVAGIERELAQLWKHPSLGMDPDNVTRAVMSNLVIYTSDANLAATIPEEISHIVRHHPARVLFLRDDKDEPSDDLEAYVSALCHMVSGGRQVCSEYITVRSTGGAARRLPFTVRSLVLGDLPTSLWWASKEAPPLAGNIFTELAGMSQQVIYESLAWFDPIQGVPATAAWMEKHSANMAVADLEWRRIRYWHRLISQSLDPAMNPNLLNNITELRIQHGPHALPKAWLLIGWMASRLRWIAETGKVKQGEQITWKFHSAARPIRVVVDRMAKAEANKLHEVAVVYEDQGKDNTVTFSRLTAGKLTVMTDVMTVPPRVIVFPSRDRASLVARQLPRLDRDEVFTDALQVARQMALALH